MRMALLVLFLSTACTSLQPFDTTRDAVAMRYSHDGYSVDEKAKRVHQAFDAKLEKAQSLIAETRPTGSAVTLVYVNNTLNLVDTPTSFTRDMGGPESPTARIAATQHFRGSSLRVIDPSHFSANMSLDCQNAANGARVFQLKTYVSNYDPAVRRQNHALSPFAQYDETSVDLSRQAGTTTDVFTIDTELTDCFGNVLRALSPVVEVTSRTDGKSIFFFSEILGFYNDRSHYVSSNLNGAKKRAIELVVAELGLYLAGVPDTDINAIFSPDTETGT